MPREESMMIHISLSETGYREVWIDLSGHADLRKKGRILFAPLYHLYFLVQQMDLWILQKQG